MRPSLATTQKHQFKRQLDKFVSNAKPGAHRDISGAVLQAAEFLNETQAQEKYILIFSDLEENLVRGQIRDFTMFRQIANRVRIEYLVPRPHRTVGSSVSRNPPLHFCAALGYPVAPDSSVNYQTWLSRQPSSRPTCR